MRFICETHKQQAIACPATALMLWQGAFGEGVEMANTGNWQQAWRAFGTALDLAFLIYKYNCQPTEAKEQLERVKISCQNLAICLYQLNRHDEADAYLLELHNWLTHAHNVHKEEQFTTSRFQTLH